MPRKKKKTIQEPKTGIIEEEIEGEEENFELGNLKDETEKKKITPQRVRKRKRDVINDPNAFSIYSSPKMKKKKKRKSKVTSVKGKKKKSVKKKKEEISKEGENNSTESKKGKLKKIKIKADEEDEDQKPKRKKRRMTKEERRIEAIDKYREKILKKTNPEVDKERQEMAMILLCEGGKRDVSFKEKVSILEFKKISRAPLPRCELTRKKMIEKEAKRKSILKNSKNGDEEILYKFQLKDVSVFRKDDQRFEDDLLEFEDDDEDLTYEEEDSPELEEIEDLF